jgi:RNA ligase
MPRNLYDLFTAEDLAAAIADRLVRRQTHPDDDRYAILNYTDQAAYDEAWGPVTLACRGLIVFEDTIVGRPWPKFFNYGQAQAPAMDLDDLVEVTDKQDGSLGIMYPGPDGAWAIATRGSFASPQAVHATGVLRDRYLPVWRPIDGWTYLWEIVFPANRIVLDYAGLDDLVLLGAVHTDTGEAAGPDFDTDWPGPRTVTFPAATLGDALALEPRPNAEGIVVRHLSTGALVKIKQADYVALHRIITNTSSRRLWEHLAVEACSATIRDPRHWGTYLHMDPERAEECMAVGGDWQARMLDGVPDEFYAWVRTTVADLTSQATTVMSDVRDLVRSLEGLSRQDAFHRLAGHDAQTVAMRMFVGSPTAEEQLLHYAWDRVRPTVPSYPFAQMPEAA